MDAKELREQINKLGTDMQALMAKAREEKRELTAEEGTSFDKMDADREKLLQQEKRELRFAELEGTRGRQTEPRQPGADPRPAREGAVDFERSAEEHNDALRAWFASQLGIPLTKAQEELCKRHGVNLQARSVHIRRPKRPLESLSLEDEKRWNQRSLALFRGQQEQRALSTLTSTSPEDGSYLIANEAMQPLERALLAYGNVRGVSTVMRTRTGANLPIPTNDDTSNEGALLAENTQAVDKDPAFGQVVLGAFKFSSKKVRVSRELFQDSNDDLGAFMFSMLGERLGRIMNRYATTGTGSSEPKGAVTAATSSGTALAAKTPTYLELVATEGALDPAYRSQGASWMFHDTMLQEIKKIVESTTGRPIWLPNMAGGAPDTILGYPYSINQHMAVAAGSGSGKSILFGAMKKFIYREVQDIEVMRLDELYAEYYQVAFVGFSRMDSDLLDAGTHPVVYTANKA
jgi:HK97 family phage major capsid protein